MGRLALAVVALLAASAGLAGGTPEHLFSDEVLLEDWRYDVYAVRVVGVDDKGATNASPPRVRLVIKKAFRGEGAPGEEIRALWDPLPSDVDTSSEEDDARFAAWERQPLRGPDVGQSYIVLSLDPLGRLPAFRVSSRCRYLDDEATRRRVHGLVPDDWRQRRRQAAIQVEASEKAARAALDGDRARQRGANVGSLARVATDVAVASWTSVTRFENGWVLEFTDARSLKRLDAKLDPDDGTGAIFVWTDQDMEDIYLVRRQLGRLLVFLDPWPEASGRVRNCHRLVGGEMGVLEATAQRLAAVK